MDVVNIKRNTEDGLLSADERCETLIQPLSYDEETGLYITNDNCIGFCFDCQPLGGGSDKELEKISLLLNQPYPENFLLSFMLFRSPDIEYLLNRAESLRYGHDLGLLSKVFENRQQFLRKHTHKDIIGTSLRGAKMTVSRVVDLRLVISGKIPFAGGIPSEEAMKKAKDQLTSVESMLKSIGFAPRVMDAEAYVRFMNVIFNWKEDATWVVGHNHLYDDKEIIAPQCFDAGTSIKVDRDCVQLGDTFVRVLSAKQLPATVYFGDAFSYIGDLNGMNQGIKENYAIVCNVYFPDVEKANAKFEKKRQWANHQAFSALEKLEPKIGEAKESQDLLYASKNKGGRLLKMSFHVMAFAKSKKACLELSTALRQQWSVLRFTLLDDEFVMLPMFMNCLPMCADASAIDELWRYKTMTSREAPALLPIFGDLKGTGTPHVQLLSRNGQLMSMSLHDSETNKNGLVVAESGSGKSFLLNEMILAYMSVGACVYVIDAGKSYKKLCESLGGDFVQFGDNNNICLNPFETIEDWEEEEDGIVTLVATMASKDGLLNDRQMAALKSYMRTIWYEHLNEECAKLKPQFDEIDRKAEKEYANIERNFQGLDDDQQARRAKTQALEELSANVLQAKRKLLPPSKMTIDEIADRCLADEDQRVRDIGAQLGSFRSNSSYGRYFSGHNNASFKGDFTVLELDELQSRKHLRQVVLLQLISQIQREIFLGERNRIKILIIDEAWDLLKEGEVSVFMEHAYRKFRKYGASAVIATQSIQDLFTSKVGMAIYENSANQFLLGQKETSIELVKKDSKLVLDDWSWHMLKSVHTEAGIYSEIFITVGQLRCLGRLIVSNFQKLLYSTDPRDVNDIDTYQKQGMNIAEAIEQVLKDRGLVADE